MVELEQKIQEKTKLCIQMLNDTHVRVKTKWLPYTDIAYVFNPGGPNT